MKTQIQQSGSKLTLKITAPLPQLDTLASVFFEIIGTCKSGKYIYARTNPRHPRANAKGLYYLHRVIMENHLGRLLSLEEDVHHLDGNPGNNKIENLQLLTHKEHARLHSKDRRPITGRTPWNKGIKWHKKSTALRDGAEAAR